MFALAVASLAGKSPYTCPMAKAPKMTVTERAAARLKKKKSGPSAVKRAKAREALQKKTDA